MLRRAAPFLTCLALAGCGGSGDEDEVRKVVEGLYAGLAERDSNRVCDSLTRKQREAVTEGLGDRSPQSCEQVVSIALSFAGDAVERAKKAKVTAVEVDGDDAKATVEYRGRRGKLGLAKEDGEWKVGTLNLEQL